MCDEVSFFVKFKCLHCDISSTFYQIQLQNNLCRRLVFVEHHFLVFQVHIDVVALSLMKIGLLQQDIVLMSKTSLITFSIYVRSQYLGFRIAQLQNNLMKISNSFKIINSIKLHIILSKKQTCTRSSRKVKLNSVFLRGYEMSKSSIFLG